MGYLQNKKHAGRNPRHRTLVFVLRSALRSRQHFGVLAGF
jgi:hypothetical protein